MSNLYQWKARVFNFDESLPLARDLASRGLTKEGVHLEIRFGPSFPQTPPYVRVIRPRFLRFMDGGGGHVTAGGTLCLEMLTAGGWTQSATMEGVLLAVRLALSSTDPRPARLLRVGSGSGTSTSGSLTYSSRMARGYYDECYSPAEAMSSYVRVARDHGWGVPPEFLTSFV